MHSPSEKVQAEFDDPILFRTTVEQVYAKTLDTGSLWLRSDQYFRQLEDSARNDKSEGVNSGRATIPLAFEPKNGAPITIKGDGRIGRIIRPHYILSLHGSSISSEQHASFGGCTFGVRSLSNLSAEVLFQVSKQIRSDGYRFGQVRYEYAALSLSHSSRGGDAIGLGGEPPVYLNPMSTDVLRKHPVWPFIEQDEWRVVVFVQGYLDDDPNKPLKINVDPSHFYEYLSPTRDS